MAHGRRRPYQAHCSSQARCWCVCVGRAPAAARSDPLLSSPRPAAPPHQPRSRNPMTLRSGAVPPRAPARAPPHPRAVLRDDGPRGAVPAARRAARVAPPERAVSGQLGEEQVVPARLDRGFRGGRACVRAVCGRARRECLKSKYPRPKVRIRVSKNHLHLLMRGVPHAEACRAARCSRSCSQA